MIGAKQLKIYSKFLSMVLRHRPEKIGIELDDAGWTDIDGLLKKAGTQRRVSGLTREILQEVVDTNAKKRFAISDDGQRIRAQQGHSVQVTLGDEERKPPDRLYHGTPTKFLDSILEGGLLKMDRHAVHLSPDRETATNVGSRRGKPVVITIRSGDMHADGFKFCKTDNDVWYTDLVPKEYLHVESDKG